MSAEKTSLISKLTLLVLTLILGCLVILIIRQNPKEQVDLRAASAVTRSVGEIPLETTSEPVHYAPLTNRTFPKADTTSPSRSTAVEPNPSREEPSPTKGWGEPPPSFSSGGLAGTLATPLGGVINGPAGVSGRVWLTGTPPPEILIPLEGTTCGKIENKPLTTRHYLVTPEGGLANVFVYVKEGLEDRRFPAPTDQPVLDNIGCQFEPYVMGVQVGQKFKVRNSDPIPHNVHAVPTVNQEFNLVLSAQRQAGQVREKSFQNAEILVRLKCDLHPWMFAYIGVLPHPFFAVTDAEGAFQFPARLPSGKYRIAARHLKAGESVQEVTIGENGEKFINFSLTVPTIVATSEH